MSRFVPEIRTFDDSASMDRFAVETILSLAQVAVRERGICHLVLSGGGTPTPMYTLLSQDPDKSRFPWAQTHVYWGDERIVPPDEPGSNYGQAQKALLASVPLPAKNIHRIQGELPAMEAAAGYREELRSLGEGDLAWPIFDVVLLGLGEDGHTASLFPGPIDPLEGQNPVIAVQADYQDRPSSRVTLTPMVFNTARSIIFLIKGRQKAQTVASILDGPYDPTRWPIHRINPSSGRVLMLIFQ